MNYFEEKNIRKKNLENKGKIKQKSLSMSVINNYELHRFFVCKTQFDIIKRVRIVERGFNKRIIKLIDP